MKSAFNHGNVSNQVSNQTGHGDIVYRLGEDSDKADQQADQQRLRDLKLTNPEHDKRGIE